MGQPERLCSWVVGTSPTMTEEGMGKAGRPESSKGTMHPVARLHRPLTQVPLRVLVAARSGFSSVRVALVFPKPTPERSSKVSLRS